MYLYVLTVLVYSSIASFAFPVFASYKALQREDLSLIKPWLMYWVVIAIQLTFETYFGIIVQNLPLYHLVRFGFMLWLVLPQFQGASIIYINHVEPFLMKYEHDIDRFISNVHNNTKSAGLEYLSRISHLIKEYVSNILFGTEYQHYKSKEPEVPAEHEPEQATSSSVASTASYADILLNRFRYPPKDAAASNNNIATSSTAYISGLLSGVLSGNSSKSKDERLSEIKEQRSKLMELVDNLDKQSTDLETTDANELKSKLSNNSIGGTKSPTPSELEFDMVKHDEAINDKKPTTEPQQKKGWFW